MITHLALYFSVWQIFNKKYLYVYLIRGEARLIWGALNLGVKLRPFIEAEVCIHPHQLRPGPPGARYRRGQCGWGLGADTGFFMFPQGRWLKAASWNFKIQG